VGSARSPVPGPMTAGGPTGWDGCHDQNRQSHEDAGSTDHPRRRLLPGPSRGGDRVPGAERCGEVVHPADPARHRPGHLGHRPGGRAAVPVAGPSRHPRRFAAGRVGRAPLPHRPQPPRLGRPQQRDPVGPGRRGPRRRRPDRRRTHPGGTLLPGHGATTRPGDRAAGRAGRPGPRRAGQRARPGGHPVAAPAAARARGRRGHRPAVQPPDGGGRGDRRRPRRDHRRADRRHRPGGGRDSAATRRWRTRSSTSPAERGVRR
jgi:hypothetical protein